MVNGVAVSVCTCTRILRIHGRHVEATERCMGGEVGWGGVKVGPSQGCGKGKQAATVTYINATPADVSNGFTFTP